MDSKFQEVTSLFDQGLSMRSIARHTGLPRQVVRRILITTGQYESENAAYLRKRSEQGATIEDVAKELGITTKALIQHTPYKKGRYNLETPSPNAIRIRACRARKKDSDSQG